MNTFRGNIAKNFPRIVYAGDRDISAWALKFIIKSGIRPLALLVSKGKNATCDKELIKICHFLGNSRILRGDAFRKKRGIKLLTELKPDYIIGIHFPYIFPDEVLKIPKYGVLNLHPAYLPYNRGWHTPSWAILEGSPYGATLHFMDKGIDTGNIIYQEKLPICPDDTADKLYNRVKKLEFKVFQKAWPSIVSRSYICHAQPSDIGTTHKKTDIVSVQSIDLNKRVKAGDLVRQLRALTTNNLEEAAYFKINNKIYRIQVKITEDTR